jgi:hypothetical protein
MRPLSYNENMGYLVFPLLIVVVLPVIILQLLLNVFSLSARSIILIRCELRFMIGIIEGRPGAFYNVIYVTQN